MRFPHYKSLKPNEDLHYQRMAEGGMARTIPKLFTEVEDPHQGDSQLELIEQMIFNSK